MEDSPIYINGELSIFSLHFEVLQFADERTHCASTHLLFLAEQWTETTKNLILPIAKGQRDVFCMIVSHQTSRNIFDV